MTCEVLLEVYITRMMLSCYTENMTANVKDYVSEPVELWSLKSKPEWPLPNVPSRSRLVRALEHLIIESGLQPGDALPPEPALCETFGVSRTRLREAIRVLSALDIVEVRHGTGTFVGHGSLSPLVSSLVFRGLLQDPYELDGLREILDVRVAMDLGNADPLCRIMMGTKNPDLEQLVKKMVDLASEGKSFAYQDREFHLRLLDRLNAPLMGQLVVAFWDVHTILTPKLGVPQSVDMKATAASHGEILEAVENGDVDAYREAVKCHYRPIRESLRLAREAR